MSLPLYQVIALFRQFDRGERAVAAARAVGITVATVARYEAIWTRAQALGESPLDEISEREDADRAIYLTPSLRAALKSEAEPRGLDVAGLVRLCLRRLAEDDLFGKVLDRAPQIQCDGHVEAVAQVLPPADADVNNSDLPGEPENRHDAEPEQFPAPPADLIAAEQECQEDVQVRAPAAESGGSISAPAQARPPEASIATRAPLRIEGKTERPARPGRSVASGRRPSVRVHFENPGEPVTFNPAYDPARDGFRGYRDVTAMLMGDPPIGRSALDQKRAETP